MSYYNNKLEEKSTTMAIQNERNENTNKRKNQRMKERKNERMINRKNEKR